MPVTGIGGFFYRANDPAALQKWYADRLGVVVDFAAPWVQQPGPTMIMPFARDTDYFAADKQWMLNLRVSGLDDLIADLRAAGIVVTTDPAWDSPETGRFARIHDPEGNPLELWEPPAD
ncbi:MAG: VOC family protein [Sphingomonadales bacterium]|nr:VOC family protein [Sphingomonadales bacterium]